MRYEGKPNQSESKTVTLAVKTRKMRLTGENWAKIMNLGTHDQVQKFLRVREQFEVGLNGRGQRFKAIHQVNERSTRQRCAAYNGSIQ